MLLSQFRVQTVWNFAGARTRSGTDLPRLWFHESRPSFPGSCAKPTFQAFQFKPFNHKPNFNIFQDSTVLTATLFSVGSTGLRILNTPCRDGHAPSGVNPQNLPRCNRPVENLGSCEVTKIKNGNNRKSLLFDSYTRFSSNTVQNLQALLHRHENLKSLENDDENKNSQSHGCSAGSAIV